MAAQLTIHNTFESQKLQQDVLRASAAVHGRWVASGVKLARRGDHKKAARILAGAGPRGLIEGLPGILHQHRY